MSVKARIVGGLLAFSLLLNVAGLVFFICFLNLSGHYKAIKRQRNALAHSLSIFKSAIMMPGEMPVDQLYRRSFISQIDGEPDSFALIAPTIATPTTDLALVVYLHGMGSNYMEPFAMQKGGDLAEAITTRDHAAAFLSCSYRKESSWGDDKAMADISQNIREVCAQLPIRRIIVMGTSMGGCTALAYAEQAPSDIKEKIVGIVSVESAGNLADLYHKSPNPSIKPALAVALGGTPEQVPEAYRKRSFLDNLDVFPRQIHVAIVSARDDEIVPPPLQKDVVAALEKRHVPVKLMEISGGHGMPESSVYLDALDFAMSGKEAAYVQ